MDVIGLDLSGKDPKPLLPPLADVPPLADGPPLVDGLSDYLRQAMDRLIGVGKVL
jgi:hypothetical protein